MMKLSNLFLWFLIMVMAFSLVGCKADKTPDPGDDNDNGGGEIIDDNDNGVIPEPITPILAFLRGGDLWVMDLIGEQRQLTEFGDITHLAWSSDEMEVALWREDSELWVIQSDGSGNKLVAKDVVTPSRRANERGLAWHPYPWGHRIAYGVAGETRIHIKDFLAGDSRVRNIDGELVQGPWWMPGGEMLYAVTKKDGVYRVTILSEQSSFVRHLDYLVQPRWTPEGLVFLEYSQVSQFGEMSYTGLGTVNGLGENYRRLLNRQLSQAAMAVSTNGRYLALASEDALDLIDISTGERERVLTQNIVPGIPSPLHFAWSEEGEILAALKATTASGAGDVQVSWDLVIIEHGKAAKTIWSKLPFSVPLDGQVPLAWSLDGEEVYVLQESSRPNFDVWVIDTKGGEPSLFLENGGLPFVRGAGLYPVQGK
jgi:hypothetical protein